MLFGGGNVGKSGGGGGKGGDGDGTAAIAAIVVCGNFVDQPNWREV